jgi:hypothetical protein
VDTSNCLMRVETLSGKDNSLWRLRKLPGLGRSSGSIRELQAHYSLLKVEQRLGEPKSMDIALS